MAKRVVILLSVGALILAAGWFCFAPGFEPAITFILGLAGLISSHFMGSANQEEIKDQASSETKPTEPLPELQVDRNFVAEIGLEAILQQQGERLFWGDPAKNDYYLKFGDYQRIDWTDHEGKLWRLAPTVGGDLPLKTSFTSKQIEQRREERKQRHSQPPENNTPNCILGLRQGDNCPRCSVGTMFFDQWSRGPAGPFTAYYRCSKCRVVLSSDKEFDGGLI